MKQEVSESERKKLAVLFAARIERYLDSGVGSCVLRRPDVAQVVVNCLENRNDIEYRFLAWCVMPNHVHVVARLFPASCLSAVMQSWKSVTARRINRILNRKGTLWGREYFDRLVRDDDEMRRAIGYVTENPVKAGLGDWNWVWSCGRGARIPAGEAPALR
jgi:REP element-mobilizing transposase RayT